MQNVDGAREYTNSVQADRVRAIRRACREYALLWLAQVVTWVNAKHAPVGEVQPGEQHQLVAGLDALECREHLGFEDDEGIGCALVSLPRRISPLLEPGSHVGDGCEFETASVVGRWFSI